MTRRVDLLSKPSSAARFAHRGLSIFLFAKYPRRRGLQEGSITCHDPQVSIIEPPRSFVPLPPSLPVFDNGERSLFPENDYADWKVRGGLAMRPEMKREMRLREARLGSS